MNLQTPPPGKLSDLIELAVADAGGLDRNAYEPDWGFWHAPQANGCRICVAGAVIAGTLGCAETSAVDATVLRRSRGSDAWRRALCALDAVREGWWATAFTLQHGEPPDDAEREKLEALDRPDHSKFHDWKSFDAHLDSLAEAAGHLRRLGL